MSYLMNYSEPESYRTGSASVSPEGIQKIDVHWMNGSVDVSVCDSEQIQILENDGFAEEERLRFRIRNETLSIQFCSPTTWKERHGRRFERKKELRLLLPNSLLRTLSSFALETVSADASISDLIAGACLLSSISGDMELRKVYAPVLVANTVSGDMQLNGIFQSLKLNAVSGDIHVNGSCREMKANTVNGDLIIHPGRTLDSLRAGTVNGDASIFLPEDRGFALEWKSVNGRKRCFFPTDGENRRQIYGDGACKVSVNTVNGSIELRPEE